MQKNVLLSTRILTLALNKVSDGVVLTDPNLKNNPIVYASAGFYTLTGYSEENVLGYNCNFLQGQGTSSEMIEEIKNAIACEKPFKGKLINYKKNGEPFLNFLRIEPIFEDGKIKYFLGAQNDYLI
ncbi:MAG: PAS domain-containing protein [Legionellaceae bacterium]|nr:PAS domain-containing protein [Legionellaceae bacterium]